MNIRAKGFTLVELIISIVIVGLLSGVIFMTYRTILDITIRVENEKIVANEMLFAHQVIQNLVDNYTIDYEKYRQAPQNNIIATTKGLTNILYLTGRGGGSTYIGGYAIELSGGAIVMTRDNGSLIPLTDPASVTVSGLQFQLIPYNTTGNINAIPIGSLHFESTNDIYHPGFWMRGMIQIANFKANDYIWSVRQPIQSFFNIRSY